MKREKDMERAQEEKYMEEKDTEEKDTEERETEKERDKNGGIYEVDVMGGQWSDEWGGDNWNYGAESDTGYLGSLATLAPAQVKPIYVSNRYECLDESIVVPFSEFIVESTRKPKKKRRRMKFAEKSDCNCGGHLLTPRSKSSLADYCTAGARPRDRWLRRTTQPVLPMLCLQLGAKHHKQLTDAVNDLTPGSDIARR